MTIMLLMESRVSGNSWCAQGWIDSVYPVKDQSGEGKNEKHVREQTPWNITRSPPVSTRNISLENITDKIPD